MVAESSSRETGKDQMESLIDELIRDILSEARTAESPVRGMTTAALFEQAFAPSREASRAATLEKLLVAEAFAAELADALAPALAERLAPLLLKSLEQLMTEDKPGGKPVSARPGRRQGSK